MAGAHRRDRHVRVPRCRRQDSHPVQVGGQDWNPVLRAAPDGAIRYITIPGLGDFAPRVLAALSDGADAPILWIDGPSLAPPWRLPEDLLAVYAEEEHHPVAVLADPAVGLGELALDELDRLQSTYAAVVTFFDAQLGRILDHLRDRGDLDRSSCASRHAAGCRSASTA